MSPAPRPSLLPIAAFVSLLVLLLGATGLFALHHANAKSVADLDRLDTAKDKLLLTLRARAGFKTQVQEWKNVLLRGRDPADFATYREKFERMERTVREDLVELDRGIREQAKREGRVLKVSDFTAQHEMLGAAYRSALASFDPTDPEAPFEADAAVRGQDRLLTEFLDRHAASVEQFIASELATISQRASARYEALRRITWIVATLAVLASLWLCFRATRPAPGDAG